MKGDDAVTAAICAPQTPSRCHRNLDEELLKIGGYFLTDRFACLSNKSKEEYVMKRFLSLSLFLSLIAFILAGCMTFPGGALKVNSEDQAQYEQRVTGSATYINVFGYEVTYPQTVYEQALKQAFSQAPGAVRLENILVWQKYYLLPIIVGVSSLSESSPSPDQSYYYTVEKL